MKASIIKTPDAKTIAQTITVQVRIKRVKIKRLDAWIVRLWIAKQIVRFGIWVSWMNLEIVDNTEA